MSNFRSVDRGTAYLLRPSVDEWLPSDHLARFVVEIVEQLDLSRLSNQYRGLRLPGLPAADAGSALDLGLCHRHLLQPQDPAGLLRLGGLSVHRR